MLLKKHIGFLGLLFLLQSCNTLDVYEKTIALPRHEWHSQDSLSFTFDIKDTLAYYNLYFVVRHTESYHYSNVWIDLTSVFPIHKPQSQRLNIQLANNNGWLGT